MASDVTREIGVDDAGLDMLLAALVAPGEPAELTGDQAALALFRSGRLSHADDQVGAWPAAPGRFATRPLRRPIRWQPRLAAAAAVVVFGGMAAAAYAAALPAPVQHLAHEVFQFAGVPDTQPTGPGPLGAQHSQTLAPATSAGPGPSGAVPGATGSPGTTAPAGSASLSAAANSTRITAGTAVVITGRLSWPGRALGGLTFTLLERPTLSLAWHAAGSVQTDSGGNGAVTVPVVGTNAVFRLAVSGVAISPDVRVTVVPTVSVALQTGSGGKADVLSVSAPYAQHGDVAVLQVSARGGAWSDVRQNPLTAGGTTAFVIDATLLANDQVRVVLLPTGLHASSDSPAVMVPPPG